MQIPHFTSSWKHGNIKYSRQEHFFPISAKWISEVHPLLLHFIIKCRYYKLLCSFNLLHFQGRCLLSEMIEQEKPKSSNFSCFGRREHLEYFFCKCLNKMNWEFKPWTGENSILEHSTGENEDEIPCCCFLERKHWSCISTVSISNALHSASHCTELCTLHWKELHFCTVVADKGHRPN